VTTVDVDRVYPHALTEVFDYMADMRHEPEWWSGVKRVDRLEGDGGLGTRYYLRAQVLGFPADADIEVTEFERPQRFVIVATGRFSYTCAYLFEPVAGGTRLRFLIDLRGMPGWLGRALMRYYMRRLAGILAVRLGVRT
jgi:hypothetical protein